MNEIRVTVGFKCTTKEKEAIESIARSQGMTISEYLKLRVSEPRIPKKAKSRTSADQPGKAPNTYNSRKPTKKKAGARTGHRGSNVSKIDVEKKIREGAMEHCVKEIGDPEKPYVTRYCPDTCG